jgi:glutaconate CoA-transferase subunit B
VTGAGFLSGGATRKNSGVRGGGPQAVVTDIGILAPDESGEMILTALHPGRTVEEARANTGWALRATDSLGQTEAVSPAELALLRELDPQGIYLKGGG